jgi:hypothetical protein
MSKLSNFITTTRETARISVVLSGEERDYVERSAKQYGVSICEFIRATIRFYKNAEEQDDTVQEAT